MKTIAKPKFPTRKTNFPARILATATMLCLLSIGGLLMWQYRLNNPIAPIGPPISGQQVIFAAAVPFDKLASDSSEAKDAIEATNLSAAKNKVGHTGAFVGIVKATRSSSGNKKLILEFSEQRGTTVRAVVRPPQFGQFPDLKQLIGKKVWVYGVFASHKDNVEIEMTQGSQIKTVE